MFRLTHKDVRMVDAPEMSHDGFVVEELNCTTHLAFAFLQTEEQEKSKGKPSATRTDTLRDTGDGKNIELLYVCARFEVSGPGGHGGCCLTRG